MEQRKSRFEGKVALITGAASGQGRAALLFAEEGARVVVSDVNGDGAEEVAREIKGSGGEAVAVATDVSREVEVKAMIEAFGRLDVLFNNAGVGYSAADRFTMASVVETPEEDWDAVLAINLKGVAMGASTPSRLWSARAGVLSSTMRRSTR